MPYAMPLTVAAPLLIHCDCLDELPKLPADSLDAYVSDPPSSIVFMGADWDSFKNYKPRTERGHEVHQGLDLLGMSREDSGFVAFMVEHWVEVLRVLKPGAYAVAWALPKTSDLAGLAMRLAGFVMDNPLLHLFSSAMAKGANPGKKIDAMMGAEREVVGVSATTCTGPSQVDGMLTSGVSGEPVNITAPATDLAAAWEDWNSQSAPGFENWLVGQKPIEGATPGRLRELTGLDYAWHPRKLKTAKAKRAAARDFVDALTVLDPAVNDWGEAVRMCAALVTIEDCAALGCTWQPRSGRSLRPGHRNIIQVLLDGEVIAERERGKFDPSPLKTIAANCIAQGVGAYHVGACRIPRGPAARAAIDAKVTQGGGFGTAKHTYGDAEVNWDYQAQDGYPKTVLLTPGAARCPAKALDAQSGVQASSARQTRSPGVHNNTHGEYAGGAIGDGHAGHDDTGGASRFYTNLPIDDPTIDPFLYTPKARKRDAGLRSDIENKHNTLKTTALMRWLMRLVCPVGGVVLSTFGGSGTDAVAAIAEGMRIVIMERRRDYFELMCSRVAAAIGSPEAAREANATAPEGSQLGLL